ncbi:tyrosine-type recombinase/integrase [Sphingobium sp. CAP-1]|uniref:tyrosine-type recombinase/integrase n=1 Tax=Sphingobium sp. CAP-1 TaxID=2676077 RepID=UPI0012BB3899|nr:site-specific integrase [Sphingobium sp. CAP-1]QGP79592.1 tyrosine-type recombinase/integrase [Sphingobium sp. CAP-1]
MSRQPAKVLEPDDVRLALAHVRSQRYPERNRTIILLSFKAGLRACEIAGLSWPMVLATDGGIATHINVARTIAKYGSARQIPINTLLRRALMSLHKAEGYPDEGPVIRSERGAAMLPGAIVNWFSATYRRLGFTGCSSHSGRRTFITKAARLLPRTGGSLRDVQELAGHRALTTTERYIQGDRDAQHKLIRLI